MATRPTAARVQRGKPDMPLYYQQGEIDYDSLEFDPDIKEMPPDQMHQELEIHAAFGLLINQLYDFLDRLDIFISYQSFICYDRRNLNVRVSPDVYVALGVDPEKIRDRRLYLPWEADKPPDWVLEVASRSTARNDVERKPAIYALIGVLEYWLFDPTGGDLYGKPLIGLRLVDGEYQPIELTTEPDGILKGYSEVLGLSLCWDDGEPRFYDPEAGLYLEDWEDTKVARRAAEAQLDEERAVRIATEVVRDAMAEQRDAMAEQRDVAEAQRDAMAEQRDAAEAQLDALAEQRDAMTEERDAARAEVEQLRRKLRRQQLGEG